MKRRCAGCSAVITGHGNKRYCTGACQERAYRRARSGTKFVLDSGPIGSVIRTQSNGKLITAAARLGYLGDPAATVLDTTYGRGGFWTQYRPAGLVRTVSDFRCLPHPDGAVPVICYDPPYVSTGSRETSSVDDLYARYGLGEVKGWRSLRHLIDEGLAECARVLAPRGYLLVKCMDYVESGRKVWNTFHVAAEGERLGLRLRDRFHHWSGGGPQVMTNLDGSPREQQHAREEASMLLVFTK